jgi:hypothetical protein
MLCTCGSAGALDGHSPSCALRKVDEPRLNRVTVGLPERVESAKASLRGAELLIQQIAVLYDQRGTFGAEKTLNAIGKLIGR